MASKFLDCPFCGQKINIRKRSVEDLCWLAERLQGHSHDVAADKVWEIAEVIEEAEDERTV